MKKRILFLVSSLGGGGAEKVLLDIVGKLNPNKYEITICTLFDVGVYKKALPEYIRYRTIIRHTFARFYSVFWRMLKYLPREWMYRLFIRGKYDVEIAFLEGLPTLLLSGSACKNKIAWVHTDLFENNSIGPYFHNDRDIYSVYQKYNKVVFVSTRAKCQFERRFAPLESATVIYNLIDKEAVTKRSKEFVPVGKIDRPVVCTVGRLLPVKGFMRLLEVHKKLINEGIAHDLWFLGVGDDEQTMKDFVYKNHLEDSVCFWGFQSNPYPFIHCADIYVCSSFLEGYPLSVAEALVLNKPIVATNCTGPSEILYNGAYGLLVENSESGIYDGLYSVLTNQAVLENLKCKARLGAESINPLEIIRQIEDIL